MASTAVVGSFIAGDSAFARGVVRIDFADQEGLVAPARERFADQFLGLALAVHLRRID